MTLRGISDADLRVALGPSDWSSVLYALDCFAAGACGQDEKLPTNRALWLGGNIRAQLGERKP